MKKLLIFLIMFSFFSKVVYGSSTNAYDYEFKSIDGDKIKIFDTDGVTALATPFGSGTLTSDNVSMEGFTIVKVTGTTEVVFGVQDNMTFTDADVTVI